MGPDIGPSIQDIFIDLTDVTLADEDANSILTDDDSNASGASWWLNL